ncbi:MAG: hypothetical protein GF350_04570, partial [Chitinivibrionales bacterium]|nr:hypothetical protein [Chitinivibrionales bacterium]
MNPRFLITALISGCVFFAGCYTQLRTVPQSRQPETASSRLDQIEKIDTADTDTFYIIVDTVVENSDTIFDTTWYTTLREIPDQGAESERVRRYIIAEDRPEYCFWTRDFLGFPELRCFDSYSDYRFHLHVNAPWWIRERLFMRDFHCPPFYYYDPYTGYCRHYRDYYQYYYPPRDYYRGPGGDEPEPGPSGQRRGPRSRSYGTDRPESSPQGESTARSGREERESAPGPENRAPRRQRGYR